ncbi:H-NS histone family protein [Burkholderia cenocepacia]|uniref:H-NS histone family protein n=1 Tax=Burkholderia cenocepacia TaxID=95486 RepID=UPI0026527108|nr:H-NS histone family protein [Burkholderia cenocepacia]MDN7455549.1 H-NS histone family protein [Burkholderia cenocepacia]
MLEYERYKEEKARIESQLSDYRAAVANLMLSEIRECIKEFGFTIEDIFHSSEIKKIRLTKPRRQRYFDPESGATWSGVGREPLWIRGKDRRLFELPKPDDEA